MGGTLPTNQINNLKGKLDEKALILLVLVKILTRMKPDLKENACREQFVPGLYSSQSQHVMT